MARTPDTRRILSVESPWHCKSLRESCHCLKDNVMRKQLFVRLECHTAAWKESLIH